jgi:hypothetical protein
VVFTSVEELYASAGDRVDGWRGTTLVELVRAWPDRSWGLAVSPATPIGVYLTPEQLTELELPESPPFTPSDEVERLLHGALTAGDMQTFLDILLTSKVLVPADTDSSGADRESGFAWQVAPLDGEPTLTVFTSAPRMPGYDRVPTLLVDFVAVVRRWPREAHRLAVNPGTEIGVRFPRDRAEDLIRYAVRLVTREAQRRAGGGPEPSAPPDPVAAPEPGAAPEPESGPEPGGIADILRGG